MKKNPEIITQTLVRRYFSSKLDIDAIRIFFFSSRMDCKALNMVKEGKQVPWDIVESSQAQET